MKVKSKNEPPRRRESHCSLSQGCNRKTHGRIALIRSLSLLSVLSLFDYSLTVIALTSV